VKPALRYLPPPTASEDVKAIYLAHPAWPHVELYAVRSAAHRFYGYVARYADARWPGRHRYDAIGPSGRTLAAGFAQRKGAVEALLREDAALRGYA
jgi:hypothetical protein